MENRYNYSALANRFKSKGETELGRLLERERIHYLYEYPTAVLDQGKTKIWYPDFTLPEYGMIIEYFGVNGKIDYDRQAMHKMQVYQDNGIEGLFLTSECFKGDWPEKIIGQIEAILQGRLERFYRR